MNNETYIQYKELLENSIENDLQEQDNFDFDDFQSQVCDIERNVTEAIEMNDAMGASREEVSTQKLKGVMKLIKQVKTDYDFYNEERELDIMFPNRHDDDFDEDSMSHESVFGKD